MLASVHSFLKFNLLLHEVVSGPFIYDILGRDFLCVHLNEEHSVVSPATSVLQCLWNPVCAQQMRKNFLHGVGDANEPREDYQTQD